MENDIAQERVLVQLGHAFNLANDTDHAVDTNEPKEPAIGEDGSNVLKVGAILVQRKLDLSSTLVLVDTKDAPKRMHARLAQIGFGGEQYQIVLVELTEESTLSQTVVSR